MSFYRITPITLTEAEQALRDLAVAQDVKRRTVLTAAELAAQRALIQSIQIEVKS